MKQIGNKEIVTVGDILKFEFLDELGISAYRLAIETKLSHTYIGKVIKGERNITADTALRFAKFFNTSAEFWLNLQVSQDLKLAKIKQNEENLKITSFSLLSHNLMPA